MFNKKEEPMQKEEKKESSLEQKEKTAEWVRQRFLDFFAKRGHTIIPSASLVPENDPSVLFNTAGMQPLVPYLLGAPHPSGSTRLVNVQKCVRTQDIDEVGDNTHDTFFEMLGNWSLGDYFKDDAIDWSFEFLMSKEEGLGLDPRRLYVTVFEGNEDAPRDNEAFEKWKQYIPESHIYFMGAKSNWWSVGDDGPCGPDTEMFYDVSEKGLGDMTKEEYMAADDRQDVVEIWNDVFMQYEKKGGKVIGKLKKHNVDTGSGLERVTMAAQGKNNIFDTDLFSGSMKILNEVSPEGDPRAKRIVADHVRTSVMMIGDGVVPSNTDRGYILRRLLRRAVRYSDNLKLDNGLVSLVDAVTDVYKNTYPKLLNEAGRIKSEIQKEETKFRQTLSRGMKEFEKVSSGKTEISGAEAFELFASYGFPLELTKEMAAEKGITVGPGFEEEMEKHKELSRAGATEKFKGGLAADQSQEAMKVITQYHTATHLLQEALRHVLGDTVFQKGSANTAEGLRFDFSFGRKLTEKEKQQIEDRVNEAISGKLPVKYEDISLEEARKRGAIGLFGGKYGDVVRVYTIGNESKPWSMEICGGPHVENTGELGHFKILKDEKKAADVVRVKAVFE